MTPFPAIEADAGLELLYEIRRELGWTDKMGVTMLPDGVRQLQREVKRLQAELDAKSPNSLMWAQTVFASVVVYLPTGVGWSFAPIDNYPDIPHPILDNYNNVFWPRYWTREMRARWRQENNCPGVEWPKCRECKGTGKGWFWRACRACKGTGRVEPIED